MNMGRRRELLVSMDKCQGCLVNIEKRHTMMLSEGGQEAIMLGEHG